MRKEPVVLRLSDGEKVGTAELDRLLDDIGVPKPRFYSYQRGKDPSKSASMAEIDRQQRGGLDEKETGRERGIGKENGTEKGTERGGRGKESERGRKEEDPQVPPPPLRVPVPDNVPTGTRRVSSLELKTVRSIPCQTGRSPSGRTQEAPKAPEPSSASNWALPGGRNIH